MCVKIDEQRYAERSIGRYIERPRERAKNKEKWTGRDKVKRLSGRMWVCGLKVGTGHWEENSSSTPPEIRVIQVCEVQGKQKTIRY